jgi:copper transporter 1
MKLSLLSIVLLSEYSKAGQNQTCITDPSNPACSSFVLPEDVIRKDIEGLCKAMPYMSGCSINDSCKTKSIAEYKFCEPFSILADVCQRDMPRMKDCSNYVNLCSNSSTAVEQCKTAQAIPSLPTTNEASALVLSICKEMPMEGCDLCKTRPGQTYPNCDILKVYAKLCKAMPDMTQCPTWKSMCKDDLKGWGDYCYVEGNSTEEDDSPPIMQMFFHQTLKDYVLFKFWVPRSIIQYVFTCVLVFILAVLHEFMAAGRNILETRWKEQNRSEEDEISLTEVSQPTFILALSARRGVYHFIEMTLGYSLMLIAMTFNVGIFLSVMLGFGFGKFFFGHLQNEKRQNCC